MTIAGLQQLLIAVLLGAQAGWAWAALHGAIGPMPWMLGAVVLMVPHAPVLALEFLLLAWHGQSSPAPRPAPRQLVRAWAGEVWAATLTFGWRQPFRSRASPDLWQGAAGRRGIVLVHGFVCNRGIWLGWMRRLRELQVPHVAVTLEPPFGDIETYAGTIDAAVHALTQATGQPPLIVAHSMGGLAVRAWLRRYQADDRMHGVVTIASPHHGTWPARFGWSRNARQMRQNSDWLRALAADEPSARRAHFTCFYGHCDNIVFPAATALLEGADNRHLPGVAHVRMVAEPAVFNEALRRLSA